MDELDEKMIEVCLNCIKEEYIRARKIFPKMNSQHEGISVIREEYLELEKIVFWEKDIRVRTWDASLEATQLAARALAFMLEVCNKEKGAN